ncbi:hypothetical protein [Patulibacter americanus]|uniref:hypothetical protein n=1 Tax=Patulibacter americanus TaxID=588672 RepID=UPI00040CC6F3|nr:hypothetical protein [Patulibacter americanus]
MSAPTRRWPSTLQIGLVDPEDGAKALGARAPFGVRWHYLSGGAGTEGSWDAWRTGDGSFATAYAKDSLANDTVPFLSYYVLQETPPAAQEEKEPQKVLKGLADPTTMKAVVADLRLALTRLGQSTADGGGAGGRGGRAPVLQVEPDLWGYVQQERGDVDTTTQIQGTDPAAAGLPNTLTGFAQLVSRIRDQVAPDVLLAYPVSIWGTNKDIVGSDPDAAQIRTMAASSVRFWRALGRPFDVMTFEYANRDAGYQEQVDGVARADAWWTRDNYARHAEYVSLVLRATGRAGILWQVPPGNTVSKVMTDKPGHYRDDKVQTLLGRKGRPLLKAYRDAGVAAVLFGSAFPNDTCACVRSDLYAGKGPDDGGYLARQVTRYVQDGPLKLRRVPGRAAR